MLCSFFRFMISSGADSGRPVGPVTRRHLRRCERCRRFQRSCRTLGEALQFEAAVLPGASGRLTEQILAGLPRTQRCGRIRPIATALAAAACVAVAAWIAFTNHRAEPPASSVSPPYAIAVPRIDLPTTWTRVFEAPLLTEARNLSNSARSGIRFLVACLDVQPAEGVTSPLAGESGPPPVQ